MMTKRIMEQIMAIRNSGEANMLDTRTVQWIANREGYYELVIYLVCFSVFNNRLAGC